MPLQKYIRDKNTGQAYELQGSGYYKPISAAGQGSADVNSISDVFTQAANEEADSIYNPMANQIKSQSANDMETLKKSLSDEYNKRGILNSGIYGVATAKAQSEANTNLESRLASLLGERTKYTAGRVGSLQSDQSKGMVYEENLAEAERQRQRQALADEEARANLLEDRKFKAEQDRLATEEAAKQRAAQLELLQAQIKSYSGGGSGAASSSLPSIDYTIKENLSDWVKRGKPAWEVEQSIIPYIAETYGISEAAAAKKVYQIRKNSLYGGE